MNRNNKLVEAIIQPFLDECGSCGCDEPYKDPDGNWNNISKEQFKTALAEGGIRKSTIFTKRKIADDLINQATTDQEINSIKLN